MKKVFLLSICLFLAGSATHSQSGNLAEPPHAWTLQECILYARQNNLQVKTGRLAASLAMQDLLQAENNRLPSVSGSLSQSWVRRQKSATTINGTQAQGSFSSNYGVNSAFVLYNGGLLHNTIKANQLLVQSARLSVEELTNEITISLTQAFLDVLLAQENTTVFKELLTTSETQLKQGKERYDAGSISKKEFLQFESQIAADRYNLVKAENTYRLSLLSLKQVLQLPTSYEMQIATPAKVEPEEAILALPLVQQAALDTRAEIKNQEVGLALAQVNRDLAKAGRLPAIDLGAGLFSGYSNYQSSKYFSQLNKNLYETFSIGASIPLFSRRQNKTNLAKADIAIEQAKLALENTRITLTQQVEQAYLNLQNAQAQYRTAKEQLKATEEIYRITQEQLRYGAINMVEVLLQRNNYIQSVQTFNQAKYTAILYNKIYQFYTGVPINF